MQQQQQTSNNDGAATAYGIGAQCPRIKFFGQKRTKFSILNHLNIFANYQFLKIRIRIKNSDKNLRVFQIFLIFLVSGIE